MKRKILCPTDFSKNAQNAIDYAIALFENETCEFYILNTYNVEAFTMELTAMRDLRESKRKSTVGLITVLERLSVSGDSTNHKFHMVSECGALIDTIKKTIEKEDIDIVVMGTKGASDSRIKIYGSQTVYAMEEIDDCPVLAIPANASYKNIKDIIFTTGYQAPYKSRQFKYLVDIAKITKAAIKIVTVLDGDDKLDANQLHNQMLLKDYFEGLHYSFHTLDDMNVQIALNTYIQNSDIDMVAFINKKHNFFRMLLSSPMVKNLGYYSTIPVLALNN